MLTHRLQVCTRTQNGIQCLHILHVHSLEYVHVAVQGRKFVNIGVASGKEGRDLHRLVFRIGLVFFNKPSGKSVGGFAIILQPCNPAPDFLYLVFGVTVLYGFVQFLFREPDIPSDVA